MEMMTPPSTGLSRPDCGSTPRQQNGQPCDASNCPQQICPSCRCNTIAQGPAAPPHRDRREDDQHEDQLHLKQQSRPPCDPCEPCGAAKAGAGAVATGSRWINPIDTALDAVKDPPFLFVRNAIPPAFTKRELMGRPLPPVTASAYIQSVFLSGLSKVGIKLPHLC